MVTTAIAFRVYRKQKLLVDHFPNRQSKGFVLTSTYLLLLHRTEYVSHVFVDLKCESLSEVKILL